MNYSVHNLSNTGVNQTLARPCPPIRPADWIATQLPTIAFGSVMTATQFFNLIIFTLWRNKEPFVIFHVALAVASLLAGLSLLAAVPLRYMDLTPTNAFVDKFVGVVMIVYVNCVAILANLAISLDRWLSVEFAVRYRTTISHGKAVFVATVCIFGVAVILVAPGIGVFFSNITIDVCSRRKNFLINGAGPQTWQAIQGPVMIPFLFASQLRILWIAGGLRLQRWRNRNLNNNHRALELKPWKPAAIAVMRIVWSSLLASMAVVCVTLISRAPGLVLHYHTTLRVSSETYRLAGYMTFVQHCASPLIYLFFWPDYRKTIFRLCRRLTSIVTPHASIG
ncbi:hypothetical protein BV898_01393 [Hypsibius exemplaris]|uniref:G-protein coupled receptors family 1 profile domain-containing protein n=1 Tax=Hypsibius exemplaris TaxID=2072580 RepID=A0A1W0XC12_HYPEX|nr:hypothetical protein BV898_01393 [Hypsibius exemplaris]